MAPGLDAVWHQQIGRLGRQGQDSVSHLIVGFSDYVYSAVTCQLRRFDPNISSTEDFQNALLNHNTSVRTPTGRSSQTTSETTSAQRTMIANIFHKQQHNMLKLVCLNRGCVHCHLEHLSGTGTLHDEYFDFDDSNFEPCEDSCFICTGEWKKLFRPIHLESLQLWLESPTVADVFPLEGKTADVYSFCDKLTSLVWNSDKTIQAIFDIKKSSITKAQVGCFFLQLIAADIISIHVTSKDTVKWRLTRVEKWYDRVTNQPTNPPHQNSLATPQRSRQQNDYTKVKKLIYRYTLEEAWSGVHLLPESHNKKYRVQIE